MNYRCFFLIFGLLWSLQMKGQSKLMTNAELEELATQMVNDSTLETRMEVSELFKTNLIKRLRNKRSLNDDFDELKSVAVSDSKDGAFRIFSWQLYISPDEYRHEGLLQFYDADRKLVILKDRSDRISRPDRQHLTVNNWFGAIYYNIVPFKLKGKTKYLLFGFDSATRTENCKIVDVLNLDKKGNISFGAPIFKTEFQGIKQTGYRHFHQYDQNAKAVLNYDADREIIIYDNLIPWNSKEIGVGLTYVPDGSYQGFELKKSAWQHIEKVFHYASEVPVTAENPFGKKQKTKPQ